ncbi:MAG: hypothetical protein HY852_17480 [Bradyrhizobium sp.]|uniref:hypothetical protein n=1 Tax=Bradyrhizobium sp. TaxID=376 RepID=UPI0025C08CBA|nr:hypothetical protein [Bradyrhizobium sp.]MBI5263603.1 hypothetical protein [Bradyrhizobium sp.]
MSAPAAAQVFRFELGDDVVARLDAGPPYDLDDGAPVRPRERPSWAVATIAAREWFNGLPHYLLSFRLDDDRCLCIEEESSIEGLA